MVVLSSYIALLVTVAPSVVTAYKPYAHKLSAVLKSVRLASSGGVRNNLFFVAFGNQRVFEQQAVGVSLTAARQSNWPNFVVFKN